MRPDLEQLQEEIYEEILDMIDLTESPTDEELKERIYRSIKDRSRRSYISLQERMLLGRSLFAAFRKLDLLQDLIEDRSISEIMVNGTEQIFIERSGHLLAVEKKFHSKQKLEDVVQQIAATSNRIVNEYTPITDARLEDGSRVNIVLPPVAIDGPVITIRKFPEHPMTMEDLVGMGALPQEAADFLKDLVQARYNLFISGGTGAGKTTFLNALSGYIPKEERIITIEDNAELQLLDQPNLVRLEARNRNTEGLGEITIRDLIRTALRMRPDRIIVGEVRSEEAVDMIMAMNTGHDGSLSTGHANSPSDMLDRLGTMILMGMNIPLSAINRQLSSAIDVIIHLGRLKDKSRKVLEIVEVEKYENEVIGLHALYQYREGKLQKVDPLHNLQKLERAGLDTQHR